MKTEDFRDKTGKFERTDDDGSGDIKIKPKSTLSWDSDEWTGIRTLKSVSTGSITVDSSIIDSNNFKTTDGRCIMAFTEDEKEFLKAMLLLKKKFNIVPHCGKLSLVNRETGDKVKAKMLSSKGEAVIAFAGIDAIVKFLLQYTIGG